MTTTSHNTDEALDPAIIVGYETWVRRFFVHRGKILSFFTTLALLVGYVAGLLGKTRDLEALTVRVGRLEASDSLRAADIQSLKQSATIHTVVLCSLSRRLDPAGTPAECGASRR